MGCAKSLGRIAAARARLVDLTAVLCSFSGNGEAIDSERGEKPPSGNDGTVR